MSNNSPLSRDLVFLDGRREGEKDAIDVVVYGIVNLRVDVKEARMLRGIASNLVRSISWAVRPKFANQPSVGALHSTGMAAASTVPSIVVYVTVPNHEVGKKLAESIVNEKLAACVNIVPDFWTSLVAYPGISASHTVVQKKVCCCPRPPACCPVIPAGVPCCPAPLGSLHYCLTLSGSAVPGWLFVVQRFKLGLLQSEPSKKPPMAARACEENPTRGSRAYSPSTHQSDSATSSPHHTAVTHFSASFAETNCGHHYSRDHPSLGNIRVAAPPCRSSPSLDGRPFSGYSFGSVSYDSPLEPTPSYPSQPLASPNFDSASIILIKKCIKRKRSPEPEAECIHFVDANDIADDEDSCEDENEVIKLDALYDLNPDLGVLEFLNLDTLVHPDLSLIKDIPLDKVYLDDIKSVSKETNLTLSTMKMNSEDSDLIVSPNRTTPNNSDLTLNNSDEDNLELEMSQMSLLPELHPAVIDPESIELTIITKPDPIDNINIILEDNNVNWSNFEPNLDNEPPLISVKPILGVAHLGLHLAKCVSPDLTHPISPCTDLNVREGISPYLPVTSLTVVPAFVLETLPHLLSLIPAGDSLGYPIVVMSHDPSPYCIPDSYILPSISSSFPITDHLSPSWMTLLDYPAATVRVSMTLAETAYRSSFVANDVFIAPPTPVPLNREILVCFLPMFKLCVSTIHANHHARQILDIACSLSRNFSQPHCSSEEGLLLSKASCLLSSDSNKSSLLSSPFGSLHYCLTLSGSAVPGLQSVYWWDGKVQTDSEELLIIKTRESLLNSLTEHVKANHEYEVPEVIALPINGGNDKYLEWIKNSTRDN
ncbi:hypothetical protein M5K25_023577 [Dendrobium thyrsiflorum]|uniref:Protein CutA n=1 Tax=Dendrobium thyrsiflorum TaxID=117978 RepID=A0ABD0U8C2_DENTH